MGDWIFVNVVDAGQIECGRAADNAVNDVTFFNQELCQVTTILTRYTCDQGNFLFGVSFVRHFNSEAKNQVWRYESDNTKIKMNF